MASTREESSKYSYLDAGYSRFFRRSIDNPINPAKTLSEYATGATQQTREINFDQSPINGSFSGVVTVGDTIRLDSDRARISIINEGDEVVALGDVSDA